MVFADAREEIGLIEGQQAGSSYEWRVAKSLWKYGWEFNYQVPLLQGRRIRGGLVVDFLVHTVPLPTALFVDGEYWHRNKERDRLARLLLVSEMGGTITVETIVGSQITTQEETDQTILDLFGRAR